MGRVYCSLPNCRAKAASPKKTKTRKPKRLSFGNAVDEGFTARTQILTGFMIPKWPIVVKYFITRSGK